MSITYNEEYCPYRLPCGICTRTNQQCPKCTVTVTPTWVSTSTTSQTDGTITVKNNSEEQK